MAKQPANYGKLWTQEEVILAFELYCRIPFQNTKATNFEVRQLASLLQRSPASVARKLGNLGSFDPELKRKHISGLTHTSEIDRQVWDEFHHSWNSLVEEADRLRSKLTDDGARDTSRVSPPAGSSERVTTRKQRLHQSFFRDAILSSYNAMCCITGITIGECLIASHIVPWSANEATRTDPTNGLCLSATFDRLFDRGLLTVSNDLRVVVSSQLRRYESGPNRRWIASFHGRAIKKPHRFLPAESHLEWHRKNVYQG